MDAGKASGIGVRRRSPAGRSLALIAAGMVIVAVGIAGCGRPSPSTATTSDRPGSPAPSTTAVDAAPLTPAIVEARLRTILPGLTLVAWMDNRDMGSHPKLVFRPATTVGEGDAWLNAILVFPTPASRAAVQDDFRGMSISGPRGTMNWDGMDHSEWVAVENVIIEVVMPGGSFGGRAPTKSEKALPDRVRSALSGA